MAGDVGLAQVLDGETWDDGRARLGRSQEGRLIVTHDRGQVAHARDGVVQLVAGVERIGRRSERAAGHQYPDMGYVDRREWVDTVGRGQHRDAAVGEQSVERTAVVDRDTKEGTGLGRRELEQARGIARRVA